MGLFLSLFQKPKDSAKTSTSKSNSYTLKLLITAFWLLTVPFILSPLLILPLTLVTFKVLDSGFQPFSDTTAVVSFPISITSPSTYSTFWNFGLNAAKSLAFITLPKI